MEIKNKNVIITGSAKRIGRAIALALAKRGANLVIHYQNAKQEADETARELESFGVKTLTVGADISSSEEVKKMVDQTVKHFGKIDVLVNNAAIYYATPFDTLTEDQWDKMIDINLKGSFLGAKYVADEMLKTGGGKIINIADSSYDHPKIDYIPYNVSKSGIISLTKGLAVTLAPSIQVNCIAPGPILLPENTSEQKRISLISSTPLKRIGSPEDIASAVVFLIEGSDFITGSILTVDGGRSI